MTTPQQPPGTVVEGGFQIQAPLRSRTGATTYQAIDPQGGAVQVTVYDASCFPSALVLERSLRELRQLATVQFPRIVPVLACGKLQGGSLFEVNPASNASALAEQLAHGPLAGPDAATIASQVGEALLTAQQAGVIHRNLGPNVVFVSPQGATVGGFAVGEPQGGNTFGPVETIAPEQVEGKVVDQRTLIYNLGALMYQMMNGRPLFAGDPASQLAQHASAELPGDVHPNLRRALGKDPRMRPMMLKQFLLELRAIGGLTGPASVSSVPSGPAPAAPAGSKPTSRGWTMFMQDNGDGSDQPASSSALAPASPAPAKPAAPASPAPAKPAAPAAKGGKPSTRGWTMFMEAADGEDGDKPADAAAVAQSAAAQPAAAQPAAAAPPAEAGAKPKTRGWTMFMEAADEDGGQASATPEPAAAAQPAVPVKPAAPAAPPAAGPQPKTRGWTMFMEAADEEGAGDAPGQGAPTSAPASPPASAQAPTPAAPAPVRTPAAPVAPDPGAAQPKTRGWTMFMEAADEEGAGDAPVAAAAPGAAPAAPVAPAAATPGAPEADAAGGKKKQRGWTMFMESPIPDTTQGVGGANKVENPLAPSPAPPPASEAADQKGWTVFGVAAPNAAEAGDASPTADAPGAAAEGPTGAPPVAQPAPGMPAGGAPIDATIPAGSDFKPLVRPTENPAAPTAGRPQRGQTVVATTTPLERPPEDAPAGPAAPMPGGQDKTMMTPQGMVPAPVVVNEAPSGPMGTPAPSSAPPRPAQSPGGTALAQPQTSAVDRPKSKTMLWVAVGVGAAAAIGVSIWLAAT